MISLSKKTITLGSKKIGWGRTPFIIAEAGVNHNGRLDLALRLVDEAARSGADAVKFQTFKAEDVVTAKAEMAAYQKKNSGKKQSQLVMLRALELKDQDYEKIQKHCKKRGIIFLSTPHGGFPAVDFLQKLGVRAFKFGSGDINNFPVLRYAARFGKPMILGTGMSTMREVKEAIQCIKSAGNDKIIVLHCTTSYPCAINDVNLLAMKSMVDELGVLVGYSDHTLGIQVPIMAATLGACVIEKHFTLDKTLAGPDHKSSLESAELNAMVQAVRQVEIILGSPIKKPTESERKIAKIARKSLVSMVSIKKGDKLTAKNIGIKRPGTGLAPKYYHEVIGRVAKKNIADDFLIQKSHYEKK